MANMTFRDRVKLAFRIIGGQKGIVTTFSEVGWQGTGETDISFEAMVGSGYHKNELIFACISKKANTAAQIGLSVSSSKDADVDDNHPLKMLIQKPNPYMSEFDFWASVAIYQALAGRAIYEKERTRGGKVIHLWPLRPDWIKTVRDGNRITAYEYQPPGLGKVLLDAKNVVDFKLFDPLGMFSVWSPVAVAARVGDADNAATDHIKGIWEHGGVPAGLIKTTQRLVEAQVENIQRQWLTRYGGRDNWQKPMVFDSDAEYQKIGFSFAELGFDVLDARSEARICMVLDVPPILVGAKVGLDRSTFSNYGEARKAWWQDSLIPMYESYLDVIQNQLGVEFGNPHVDWNFEDVPALQEDRNARWTRGTTALQAGGITVNEFCKEVGLEDKGPAGEYYLRSMAIVEVPAKIGRKPDPEPVVMPEQETPEEPEEDEPEETPEEEMGPWEKSLKAKPSPDEIRRKHERIITTDMKAYFGDELVRIRKAIGKKGLTDIANAFWEHEDDILWKLLLKRLLASTLSGAMVALDGLMEMGIGIEWALVNQAAIQWASKYSYQLAKNINDTSQKFLQSAIPDWINSGEPLDALIDRLTPTFGPVRAEMIGVTEVTRSYAEGNLITWKESGVVEASQWRTAEDELVCPICEPLNMMIVTLGENGYTTEEGGIGITAPPAHVNCRCALYPVVNLD